MNAYYLLLIAEELSVFVVCSALHCYTVPFLHRRYSPVKREGSHASCFAGQERLWLQLAHRGATLWLSVLLAQGQGLLLSH